MIDTGASYSLSFLRLTIAYQIGLLHPLARNVIIKAIKHDPDLLSREKSRRVQFTKLVIEPLRELELVWKMNEKAMVFDAADEGATFHEDRIQDLLSFLANLLRDSTLPISGIFFTSRATSERLGSVAEIEQISENITPLRIDSFSAAGDR